MPEAGLKIKKPIAEGMAEPDPQLQAVAERGRRVRKRLAILLAIFRYPNLLACGLALPVIRIVERTGHMGSLLRPLGAWANRRHVWRRHFRRYRARPSDVFVCTYFRCGTTWTIQIAHQVATRGHGDFRHVHDVVPWPDRENPSYTISPFDDSARRSSPTGLRVIKTHVPRENLPFSEEARYICVVRDPKDAFVSGYHFLREVAFGPLMPSVADWLDFFLSERFLMGSWAAHVAAYWQQRRRPNVLFLAYGEMKRDRPAAVRRIADFMDVRLAPREFELVCEKSSFRYMKSVESKFHTGRATPLGTKRARMMRKGQHGGAAEMLSVGQRERIDAHCRSELLRLGSDFPYDEICAGTG